MEDLNKDTGMATLLMKLVNLFQKEEKDQIYEPYLSFDRIMRDCSMSMEVYAINFEQRYSHAQMQDGTS